jgi:hypothetical protein
VLASSSHWPATETASHTPTDPAAPFFHAAESRAATLNAAAPVPAPRASAFAQKDKGTCRFSLEGHEDEFYDYYDLHALADDSPDWHEEELADEAEDEAMDDEHVRVHVVYRPATATAAAAAVSAAAVSAAADARGDGSSALVLGGGRELGHRSLRRFYGQSYRAEQPEQAQVQRLLLHYQQMGVIRAAPLAAGGIGGARNDRARRDITKQERSQLSLSLKNNTLMRKKGQPSQNIIFVRARTRARLARPCRPPLPRIGARARALTYRLARARARALPRRARAWRRARLARAIAVRGMRRVRRRWAVCPGAASPAARAKSI